MAAILSDDYTRAEFLRDRLIPKAVLFFTGEAVEEEDEEVRFKPNQVCCFELLPHPPPPPQITTDC